MRNCYTIPLGHTCAIADLTEIGERHYELNRINVPVQYRRRQYGTILMQIVLADADKEGVTIYLWINGTAGGLTGMNEAELRNWYTSFGWITNQDGSMTRPPKGQS